MCETTAFKMATLVVAAYYVIGSSVLEGDCRDNFVPLPDLRR